MPPRQTRWPLECPSTLIVGGRSESAPRFRRLRASRVSARLYSSSANNRFSHHDLGVGNDHSFWCLMCIPISVISAVAPRAHRDDFTAAFGLSMISDIALWITFLKSEQ